MVLAVLFGPPVLLFVGLLAWVVVTELKMYLRRNG